MREIARRFNERFGETFVVPEHRIPEIGARIMDLQDPTSKMTTTGSSEAGIVLVTRRARGRREEDPERRHRLGHRGPSRRRQGGNREPDRDPRRSFAGSRPEEIEREFDGSGYGDFKAAVADAVVEYLTPVRERYAELRADEGALEAILAEGAEKARAIASETLRRRRRRWASDRRTRRGGRAAPRPAVGVRSLAHSIAGMRRLFPLVACVVLLDTVFFAGITPLLPEYSRDLGLSNVGGRAPERLVRCGGPARPPCRGDGSRRATAPSGRCCWGSRR